MNPREDNDIIWAGGNNPVAAFDRHSSTLYLNSDSSIDNVSRAINSIEYVSRNNYEVHWRETARRTWEKDSVETYAQYLENTRMNVQIVDANSLRQLLEE